MKFLAPTILTTLLFLPACALVQPKQSVTVFPSADHVDFKYDVHVGAIAETQWGICLESPVLPVSKGARVQVIVMSEDQGVFDAIVKGPCGTGNPAPIQGAAKRRYVLELIEPETDVAIPTSITSPAIGVISSVDIGVASGRAFADLDGDRFADTFKSCSDGESVHLTVWNGTRPVWHLKANASKLPSRECTPEEMQSPGT